MTEQQNKIKSILGIFPWTSALKQLQQITFHWNVFLKLKALHDLALH